MKNLTYIIVFLLLLSSCGSNERKDEKKDNTPVITNSGQNILFPDTEILSFFKTEKVNSGNITAEFTAPAKIAATIVKTDQGASNNIVLFEDPSLSNNYTQLLIHKQSILQKQNVILEKKSIVEQRKSIIKQKQIELERMQDLALHGVSTGKDVADAKTDILVAQSELSNSESELKIAQNELANEQTGIIEHESYLKSAGFNTRHLLSAGSGLTYIICDIPENQIGKIKEGQFCNTVFTAFPNEKFIGKIDAVADVVDNSTRMVKVRISINNSSGKLKAGMFAIVSFGLSEGNFISISKNSLITVQGKNYVFVKKSGTSFERRETQTGQQIGDKIIVFSGLNNGDEIAVEGVMQLKGLSFGY